MKVKIIEEACIGCGACEAAVSDVFELNDNGIAYVKSDSINEENKDAVMDAANSCPTGAIEIEDEEEND